MLVKKLTGLVKSNKTKKYDYSNSNNQFYSFILI